MDHRITEPKQRKNRRKRYFSIQRTCHPEKKIWQPIWVPQFTWKSNRIWNQIW